MAYLPTCLTVSQKRRRLPVAQWVRNARSWIGPVLLVGGAAAVAAAVERGLLSSPPRDAISDAPADGRSRAHAEQPRVFVLEHDITNLPEDVQYDQAIVTSQVAATFLPNYQPEQRSLVVSRELLTSVQSGTADHAALNVVLDGGHILFALASDSKDIVGYLDRGDDLIPFVEASPDDEVRLAGTGYFYNHGLETWSVRELLGVDTPLLPATPTPDQLAPWPLPPYGQVHGFLMELMTTDQAADWGVLQGDQPDQVTNMVVILDWSKWRFETPLFGRGSQNPPHCSPFGAFEQAVRILAPAYQCRDLPEVATPWPCPPGRNCPNGIVTPVPGYDPDRKYYVVQTRINVRGSSSNLSGWRRRIPCAPDGAPTPGPFPNRWWCSEQNSEDFVSWQKVMYIGASQFQHPGIELEAWEPADNPRYEYTHTKTLGFSLAQNPPASFGYSWQYTLKEDIEVDTGPDLIDRAVEWDHTDEYIINLAGRAAPTSVTGGPDGGGTITRSVI